MNAKKILDECLKDYNVSEMTKNLIVCQLRHCEMHLWDRKETDIVKRTEFGEKLFIPYINRLNVWVNTYFKEGEGVIIKACKGCIKIETKEESENV